MTLFRVVVVATAVLWTLWLCRLYLRHSTPDGRLPRSFRRISIVVILSLVLVTTYCFFRS